MFNLVIATDKNGGIGINNTLPWSFRKDMLYFKHLTTNPINKPIIIYGRNTMESLPNKKLDNRYNIVITSHEIENIVTVPSLNKALEKAKQLSNSSEIFVIGGKQLYEEAFNHYLLDKVYHTYINSIFNCDKYVNIPELEIKKIINYNDIDRNTNIEHNVQLIEGFIKNTAEKQYLRLLDRTLNYGEIRETRNGNVRSIFSQELDFDASHNFPLLTTKKMFLKGIIEELLFFIRGDTDTKKLSNMGIKIWEGNTNREFLDKMKFNYNEGEMGPMYGYQWRFYNKPYNIGNNDLKGIDQLLNLINEIKNNPSSRRLLITDFNPSQVNEGVLYPCHSLILQFYVDNDNISVKMYQRSADLFLGLPFNIASTTLLLYIIAKLVNKKPDRVIITLGDCHIYEEHIEQVKEQLSRTMYNEPKLQLPNFSTLEEVENLTYKDFELVDYTCHPSIKARMIA